MFACSMLVEGYVVPCLEPESVCSGCCIYPLMSELKGPQSPHVPLQDFYWSVRHCTLLRPVDE